MFAHSTCARLLAAADSVRPDFKPSPFYEIVDTVLPLQDLPGTHP